MDEIQQQRERHFGMKTLGAGDQVETEIGIQTIGPSKVMFLYALTAAGMIIVAVLWAWFRSLPLFITINPTWWGVVLAVLVSLVMVLINLLLYVWFRTSKRFVQVKLFFEGLLLPLLFSLSWRQMLFLSLAAGFAEELLFRGVVQTEFGIVVASLLFGLVHTYNRALLPYGIWVMLMGAVLGILVRYTGELFTAMLTHAIYDFLTLVLLKRIVHSQPT